MAGARGDGGHHPARRPGDRDAHGGAGRHRAARSAGTWARPAPTRSRRSSPGRASTCHGLSTVAAALTQSRAPGTAVVIADPGQLAPSSLPKLAAAPADLLIIAPTRDALAGLVPGVTLAAVAAVASYPPRCSWPGARLAGPADMGGLLLRSPARGGWRCYPVGHAAAARPAGARPGQRAPPRSRLRVPGPLPARRPRHHRARHRYPAHQS